MIDFLNYDIKSVLLMVIVPLIFVAFLIPTIKKVAVHVGALDIPNQRKVHKNPIPRLGGLGIFLGFLAGYMIFCEPTVIMNSILIGSFIIILTGILDDIRPLKAKHKFLAQICACLVVIIYGGVLLKDVGAFGFHIEFGIFAYPITLFFMLGCINCINLIDGLDGLAGGIASIFFLTIAVIAYAQGVNTLAFIIALIMLGSTLGFLVHNFHPAKIFMGDTGSMFLGFIISVITLLGFKTTLASSIIIPMFVLVIPIFDTLCAIIRRKLKGESISTPDKQHFHHQLLRRDCSQVKTVLIIYAITILFSSASVIYVLLDRKIGYIVYGILLLVLLLVSMFKTDIIFEKRKKVLFIASTGGHLNELLQLESLFKDYDYHLITEKTKSNLSLKKKYNVNYLVYGTKDHLFPYLFKFAYNCLKSLALYLYLRPQVIVTTGTHTAVPICYIAKLFGKKIIFIETFANINTKTLAGHLIYPIADTFIVQWEEMLKLYPKAIYGGWIF